MCIGLRLRYCARCELELYDTNMEAGCDNGALRRGVYDDIGNFS